MSPTRADATSRAVRCWQRCMIALTLLAVPIGAAPAHAQLMNQLKGALGSGQESGSNPLGGLTGGVPSVDQASPTNLAGVLQYCVRNNYVSGSGATSVKNALVGKVAPQASSDGAFQAGDHGTLQTGQGNSFSLGGSGMKAQVTRKVCDLVLQHAKTLL